MNRRMYIILLIFNLGLTGCSRIDDSTLDTQSIEQSIDIKSEEYNMDVYSDFAEQEKLKVDENANVQEIGKKCIELTDADYEIYTEAYKQDNIKIDYPQITRMDDEEKQEAINELIREDIINTQVEDTKKNLENEDSEITFRMEMKYEIQMQTSEILSILYVGNYQEEGPSASNYYWCIIDAITIDLQNIEKMELTDFVDIDVALVKQIKECKDYTNQIIEAVEGEKEALTPVIQEARDDFIIDGLLSLEEAYQFCVTEDAIRVSIATVHAGGDYILFSLPIDVVTKIKWVETESTYAGEECKTISFGELQFELPFHHVKSEIIDGDEVVFTCEKNEDIEWEEKDITVRIQKCENPNFHSFEGVKVYFSQYIEYKEVEVFSGTELSNIFHIYRATGAEKSCYLVECEKSCYYIESEDDALHYGMFGSYGGLYIDDYREEKFSKQIVECAKGKTVEISFRFSYLQKEAEYVLDDGIHSALHLVYKATGEEQPYSLTLDVYTSDMKQPKQTLQWERWEQDELEFLDVNQDGYVDLHILIDSAPAYGIYDFYIWDEEEQLFQKVIYDGVLAEIKVYDGYLLNWIRSGNASDSGYVIEKLVWDGNELVKESEEIIVPEQE